MDEMDELNHAIDQIQEAWRCVGFAVQVLGAKGTIDLVLDHFMCVEPKPAPNPEEPF
jgi:hypothetical protein